jgi:hypothetical protein
VSSGGNVTVSVGGTSNVAVFSTGGMNVTANVTGGNLNAAGLSLSGNVVSPLNVTGNITGGNLLSATLSLSGNVISAINASSSIVAGTTISAVGNITGGNINTRGLVSVVGNITGANVISSTSFTATANVVGGNIITAADVSAASVSASGTVIGAGNITGANINTGGLITATGNVTGGNISTAGLITATGNIASTANVSGGNIIGTLIGNVTGTTVSVTGNITGGNLNAAGLSLSSNVVSQIATTANVTGGNLISTGIAQAANTIVTGAITTPSWTTTGVGIRTVASTYTDSSTGAAGTAASNHVHVLAQPTIAGSNSVVTTTTAATLYIAGAPANGTNMTVTNPYAVLVNAGNVGVTANINGGNIISAAAVSAVSVSASGNITGGNVLGGADVNATLHSGTTVSMSGNITGANLIVNGTAAAGSAVLIVSGNIQTTAANNVANIGNVTNYFNTVHAKATTAQYADLAEWYEADADYPPGTVLIFGGNQEVTLAVGINDVRVAGVVSTNPAHIMNSGLKAPHIAAVALTGRVPTLVVGAVAKGDMMVTAGGGRAQACAEPRMGSVIGKALQDHPGGQGTIEIVVGRL